MVQLFSRALTSELLAHQEQFSWELGHPLNPLHQVPYYLHGVSGECETGAGRIPPHTARAPCSPSRPYPDQHREEAATARGQIDIGVQQVLVDVGVGEEGKPGQERGHLQVQAVRLKGTHGGRCPAAGKGASWDARRLCTPLCGSAKPGAWTVGMCGGGRLT